MSRTKKAYKNLGFLNSPAARTIRIMCEYEEPRQRFEEQGVSDTVVLFGSARTLPREIAEHQLKNAETALAEGSGSEEAVAAARGKLASSRYYEDARELARKMTEWSLERDSERDYLICTGGGPGIMEAGNRGAADVEGGGALGLESLFHSKRT